MFFYLLQMSPFHALLLIICHQHNLMLPIHTLEKMLLIADEFFLLDEVLSCALGRIIFYLFIF